MQMSLMQPQRLWMLYCLHLCLDKIRYFEQFRPLMTLKLTFRFNIQNLCGCIRLICINLVTFIVSLTSMRELPRTVTWRVMWWSCVRPGLFLLNMWLPYGMVNYMDGCFIISFLHGINYIDHIINPEKVRKNPRNRKEFLKNIFFFNKFCIFVHFFAYFNFF